MNHAIHLLVLVAVGALCRTAQAQESGAYFDRTLAAPRNAFEMTLSTGYTQPLGLVQRGNNIHDLGTAGGGVEFGAGWRMTPRFMLGGAVQYYDLTTGSNAGTAVRGGVGGLDGTYHFMPFERLDPWVKLGVGYRLLWNVSDTQPNTMYHGFEFGKLAVGADVRVSPAVAFAPFVGADMNVFYWQRPEGGSTSTVDSPRINTFLYAGVQARFDIGVATETPYRVAGR